MEFNATIDLIIKDLDEARKIIDDLKNYPGVPVLQIELAKAKCKSAGEVISLLKKNVTDEVTEILPPARETKKKTVTEADVIPQLSEKKSPAVTAEKAPRIQENKEEQKQNQERPAESSIIADKFSHLSSRFNEQLAGMKSDGDVTDILKTKHLNNLSDAIGVNDKFLFIREIFDGNRDAYNQAISRLENTESLKDAKAVIMSYTGTDNENDSVRQLLDLVKRKLPSNE